MSTANTNVHPQYADNLKIWETVRDAAKPNGVKDAGVKYLPRAANHEESDPQDKRYKSFKQRAMFYGFTQETVSGLLGLAFRQGITVEANGRSYIEDNIDGDGVGIEQQSKSAARGVMKYGRSGLLVDFPVAEGPITVEMQRELGLNATVNLYDTFSIKNWATTKIGSSSVLSLVVLEEKDYRLGDDGLTVEEVDVERRLMLDDEFNYYVELAEDDQVQETIYPRDSSGSLMGYIPFYFIGSVNNDSNVDDAPLFPIADLNIGHYRNSADYENSVWISGQPQPWASGLTQNWVDQNMKGFMLGSGVMLALPDGASFGIEQAAPNPLAYEAMQYKQQAMVAMGAKLISSQVSFGSASEAIISSASENSRLQTIIDNVESAYNMALMALADFMGGEAPEYEINTDLSAVMADPQLVQTMVASWQAGLVPRSEVTNYMRKVGMIEKSDEELEDEVADTVVDLDAPPEV